ncbi:MAG: hypothetical protein DMG65_22220 [Candidatus Angelobacter sp. Gp1-AA117]|nr:MAG: hypothetical protein DMG65_22220 [Candidatus Angelobacter sp. Gp1-AA117]
MKSLSLIFLQDRKRIEEVEFYRAAWAETRWVLEQVLPYVPEYVREYMQQEYNSHMADPNFSFYKETFGEAPQTPVPVAVRLQKHSSRG